MTILPILRVRRQMMSLDGTRTSEENQNPFPRRCSLNASAAENQEDMKAREEKLILSAPYVRQSQQQQSAAHIEKLPQKKQRNVAVARSRADTKAQSSIVVAPFEIYRYVSVML